MYYCEFEWIDIKETGNRRVRDEGLLNEADYYDVSNAVPGTVLFDRTWDALDAALALMRERYGFQDTDCWRIRVWSGPKEKSGFHGTYISGGWDAMVQAIARVREFLPEFTLENEWRRFQDIGEGIYDVQFCPDHFQAGRMDDYECGRFEPSKGRATFEGRG